MNTNFKNLKNDLEDFENEVVDSNTTSQSNTNGGNSKTANYILLFVFIASLLAFTSNRINYVESIQNPFNELTEGLSDAVDAFNDYDPELLQGMRVWMEDLGYGSLTDDELIALRDEGVTATKTQAFYDAGFEPTLEQLVDLERADVSTTFAVMMRELGYELTIEQLAESRRNGVTAFFTSNLMDLGYTIEQLPISELMAMRNIGVTHRMVEKLIKSQNVENRGTLPTIPEIKRYAISNQ